MQYAAAYQPRIGFSKGTMGDPYAADRFDMVDTALGILISARPAALRFSGSHLLDGRHEAPPRRCA
jgi:hypothetical protein